MLKIFSIIRCIIKKSKLRFTKNLFFANTGFGLPRHIIFAYLLLENNYREKASLEKSVQELLYIIEKPGLILILRCYEKINSE